MILHYRRSGVTKSQLIDYLFEDRDVQNATHSLHVQLHNLRRMLRQAGLPDTDYFRRENDTYFWTPEIPVREDAEEFEQLCDDVRKAASGQEELRLCLHACQVYGGDFFGVRTNNGWAAREARRYEQLFIECTERAAGRLRENRNYAELEQLGQHASRVQPFFDWERLTMEALIEQGRYAEAKKLYMVTEQNYRTDMDLPVGRQMTELYQKELPHGYGLARRKTDDRAVPETSDHGRRLRLRSRAPVEADDRGRERRRRLSLQHPCF